MYLFNMKILFPKDSSFVKEKKKQLLISSGAPIWQADFGKS